MGREMTNRAEVDVRDLTRVLVSGTVAYVAVHVMVLPQLMSWGVSLPTYFYTGVFVTGAISVILNHVLRRRDADTGMMAAD